MLGNRLAGAQVHSRYIRRAHNINATSHVSMKRRPQSKHSNRRHTTLDPSSD